MVLLIIYLIKSIRVKEKAALASVSIGSKWKEVIKFLAVSGVVSYLKTPALVGEKARKACFEL